MQTALMHAFLLDVMLTGSGQILKKKLLWMLGRKNDGASAWKSLIDEWEELTTTSVLHGTEWGGYITLTATSVDDIKAKWC